MVHDKTVLVYHIAVTHFLQSSDAVRKSLVWVTPVRRSTRRSQGGRLSAIQSAHICDSPSKFSKHEEDCEVVMVPNMALGPLLVD